MLDCSKQFDPDRAFGWIDLKPRKTVLLAVSGGSDSTALLIVFKNWADRIHPALRTVCVTVDHGLRQQSAAEARQVGALCMRLGIEHQTKRWTGKKPETGLAEVAREARYALLAEAAREIGSDIILTGHTADDQAETVLMRSARGSGRGLAGMARVTLYGGNTWIARPLLAERRESLRRVLQDEDMSWIDDPTNFDEGYERVQARRQIEADPDKISLVETAVRHGIARTELAQLSATLLEAGAKQVSPGLSQLNLSLLDTGDAVADVWRVLLACTGGRAHLANRHDVARLIERLGKGRSCLSGTVATKRRDSVYLHRELRKDHRLRFCNGLFDGRYRISPAAAAAGWRLVQRDPDVELQYESVPDAPDDIVKAAMLAEPLLDRNEATEPQMAKEEPNIQRYLAPFDHFLPEFDLALANAAANLYGRKKYPAPPVNDQFKPEF